jgi:hypothetical protein
MQGLHLLKPNLRYSQYPNITQEIAELGPVGHLIDIWFENGYSMGLWKDNIDGNGQTYVIFNHDYRGITDDKIYAKELIEQVRRPGRFLPWHITDEYMVDESLRSTQNVIGEPEYTELPEGCQHAEVDIDGYCYDCSERVRR